MLVHSLVVSSSSLIVKPDIETVTSQHYNGQYEQVIHSDTSCQFLLPALPSVLHSLNSCERTTVLMAVLHIFVGSSPKVLQGGLLELT